MQAFLDAPVFQTRWRWNATISLAVPRNRGGRKVAPQLQRDAGRRLMAAVFPDAAACLENIPGDRQIPDHPLATRRCATASEAMDFEGLRACRRAHSPRRRGTRRARHAGAVVSHTRSQRAPYAFLDDAPLEERRAHAVQSGEPGNRRTAANSAIDPSAIDRVRAEVTPARDADELHDALLSCGFLTSRGDRRDARKASFAQLAVKRRACMARFGDGGADRRRCVAAQNSQNCSRSFHRDQLELGHRRARPSAPACEVSRGGPRRNPARAADDRRPDHRG